MKSKRRFNFQHFVAGCTLLVFIFTILPGYVVAAEKPATITLEQAIKNAKVIFEVPEEFTRFYSGYNQYDNRQVWQLHWETEKAPSGNMSVQIDGLTGEILAMNLWQSSVEPRSQGKLPAISRQEAIKIAEDLLKRLQPQRVAELKLSEENGELLQLSSWGAGTYSLRWVRQVQGVPFPQDGVTINVDNQTGRIMGYQFNWTEADFPDAGNAISVTAAEQAWQGTEMFRLQYFRPGMIVLPEREGAEQRPVLLVYRLEHPSAGVIDALSGEPLDLTNAQDELLRKSAGMGNGEMLNNAKQEDAVTVTLTPQEIEELEAASQVISQEEAVKVVQKWVPVPAELRLQGAFLNKDEGREAGARTWQLNWQYEGKDEAKVQVRWLSAQVDALNGTLLSFSLDQNWLKKDAEQVQRLTREEAQEKAEAFLRKIQPELFSVTKLAETKVPQPRPLIAHELPESQFFNYQRLVNEVVFPDNGFTVTVDTETGQIQSYALRWQQLQFPSPAGILTPEQMSVQYMNRQPLTLQYMQTNVLDDEEKLEQEIRLVYCPVAKAGQQVEAMSDARTGEALDWQGKPLAERPQPYIFSDISGHWAENEIALLGQAGIFGEFGDKFSPDAPVTVAQYFRALLIIERGAVSGHALSDEEVMEQARQRGWLKEELKAEDTINRLLLAQFGIRFLGFDRVARVEGIYQAPYQDLQQIPTTMQGYVALSWGLGLLKGEQGYFHPEQTVPRAQAAVVLIRMLQVELS